MNEYIISCKPDNPGQVLASCGLLALCDGIGRFDAENEEFILRCDVEPKDVVLSMRVDKPEEKKKTGEREAAFKVYLNGRDIVIDWFAFNDDLKTWAGQSTLVMTMADLINLLPNDALLHDIFSWPAKATAKTGFDYRSAYDPVSLGYSPNELKGSVRAVKVYPAVDLLATIGIQCFRVGKEGNKFTYYLWSEALPLLVARAAFNGAYGNSEKYVFRRIMRGQGTSYFGRAKKIEKEEIE